MLFPTIDFAIFFVVVFLGHWLLNPHPRPWKVFMIVASYVFYGWWDWRFVFLLAAATAIAQAGARAVERAPNPRRRRLLLAATVVGLLGLLVWFKYYGFLSLNLDNALHAIGLGPPLPLVQVALPIGISFFTFMAISYVVDVSQGELPTASWLDIAVYLSFFPHLVSGPVVRGRELLPQVRARRDPRRIDYARAGYLIFGGLFKKVVVSSFLASAIVDPVFGTPGQHTSIEILVAIYAYAVQIYADFSGYTDIAIGVALLLGFRFPENFNAPYAARSIQDFWRRWHMTLSRWLRDYLYVPLGGSRGPRWKTYRNIMITMVLGGLWHGASWTFVLWGAYHGVCLAVGRLRRQRRSARGLPPLEDRPGAVILQRVITFHLVCLGWVLFRADSVSTALALLGRLVTSLGPAPSVTPLLLAVIAGVIAAQYLSRDLSASLQDRFSRLGPAVQGAALAGGLYLITSLGPQGVAPFIYFRF